MLRLLHLVCELLSSRPRHHLVHLDRQWEYQLLHRHDDLRVLGLEVPGQQADEDRHHDEP
ncbi:hypothetical protein D3C80_1937310 [compost metagenome]